MYVFCSQVPVLRVIGSLSNDDDYVNKNGKKAKVSIGKTTILHVHHAFLYISLPSLHDYDVKISNFTFCQGREHKITTFFFFSELWYRLLEFNSREKCQHLMNWTRRNEREKVWSGATSPFKWRFRSCRRRCCLSSLIWHKGSVAEWLERWTCNPEAPS